MPPKPYNNKNKRLAEIILDRAKKNQLYVTISIVVVNLIILALVNHYKINIILGAAISIVLLALPVTINNKIKQQIKTKPETDYAGYWKYSLTFSVIVDTDDERLAEPIKHLKDRFHGSIEHGVTLFENNGIDLRVVFAKGEVKKGAKIQWTSDPAIFDSYNIRWFFIGEIIWDSDIQDKVGNLSRELNGFEYYTVDERDKDGRPTHMSGKLLGCNQDLEHFSMKAIINYERISKDEYDNELANLSNKIHAQY